MCRSCTSPTFDRGGSGGGWTGQRSTVAGVDGSREEQVRSETLDLSLSSPSLAIPPGPVPDPIPPTTGSRPVHTGQRGTSLRVGDRPLPFTLPGLSLGQDFSPADTPETSAPSGSSVFPSDVGTRSHSILTSPCVFRHTPASKVSCHLRRYSGSPSPDTGTSVYPLLLEEPTRSSKWTFSSSASKRDDT